MHKTASRKISILLSGFMLLAWAAILPPSRCDASMHELSNGEMAAVYAYGFSTFSLTGDVAKIDLPNVTARTWTEIASMKMGYYDRGGTTAWDNDWTNVSLGSSATDLVAKGIYMEVTFSNISDPANRKLESIRIGTRELTGAVAANFNRFTGTLDNNVTTHTRAAFGASTITATDKTGFNLTLSRIAGGGNQMGYSFNWASATKTP